MKDGNCTRAQRRRVDGRIPRLTGIEKRRRGDRKIWIKLSDTRKKKNGARLWWMIGGAGDELTSSTRTSGQRESSRDGQLERDDEVEAAADLWRAAAVKP